jgi:WD40 repeat protein
MNGLPHSDVPRVRLFISSPSDVLAERGISDRVIARLDSLWQTRVRLSSERWERRFYEAAQSFQAAIGAMTQYDVVVGILWKRMGSPLPPDLFQRDDGSSYESGTAFEIETALAAGKDNSKPAVYVFRKTAPVAFNALTVEEEQKQYNLMLQWWKLTMSDESGRYRRGHQNYETLEEFEESLTKLIEQHLRDLGLISSGVAWDIKGKGSPYPGLLPYDSNYSSVFYGRSLAVAGALTDLKEAAGRDAPALIIVGPSGSGKSSLALAGLIPNLTSGPAPGIDFWRVLLIAPAQDSVLALTQRLYAPEGLPELAESPLATPEAFAALARQSVEGAVQVIKWGLDRVAASLKTQIGGGRTPAGRLLMYVDQLETVLGTASQHTLAALVRALVASELAWLIATLRSDRYADLQTDPDFLELRKRSALFDLPPPGTSEIADIITGPAHAAGLVFEKRNDVSLAKVIGTAVIDADALPLLQMTLASLCAARSGSVLEYGAYEKFGGIEGAIAAHAETVFETVSAAGQAMLDTLLQALVADIDDASRLTLRTPKIASLASPAMNELLTKMTEARLLVSSDGSVRVAHEALLRRWQRAAASPALQPEVIRLSRRITPNLELWSKTKLDGDLLQPGTALAAAETILQKHPGALPKDMENYIARSAAAATARASAETRSARRRTYIASAAAVVLAISALIALRLYQDANHNFVLALLTRANVYLIDKEPTHASVLANSLDRSTLFERPLAAVGISSTSGDETVRIKTIAQVTGAASTLPQWTFVQSSPANAISFSPDGSSFAVGYANGNVILLRSDRTGGETDLVGEKGRIWALHFGSDGTSLVTATSNDVVIWDLRNGGGHSLCAGVHQVTDVAYDPTGRYVAWSAQDGRIAIWNLKTSQLQSIDEQNTWALAVDFSADGTLLASSGEDGTVVIRRTDDWSIFKVIHTGRLDIVSLSFRPDGHAIATASLEGPVDVWDLQSEAPEKSAKLIPAQPNKRWKVRYSPDGQWLAVASWDGSVTLADGRSLQYRGTIDGNDQRVNDISFAPKTNALLTADESGVVRRWDLSAIQPIFDDTTEDSREVLVGQYSPDGSKFAAGGKDGIMTVYHVGADGRLSQPCTVQHKNWVTSVSFSADSQRVASVGMAESAAANVDDGIQISDSETCRALGNKINANNEYIRSVAFNPSANELAWSTRTGNIWLADLDGAINPMELPSTHTQGVEEIDFDPSGKFLATAGRDGRVVIWNVAARAVERVLRDDGPALFTIKFAPNGKLVAGGGAQGTIQVWDIDRPKGSELIKALPLIGGANRLAFKHDGSVLAVGSDGRYISMWSTASWDKIFELDALVGVRSVYGFNPILGDLAFDGELGVIRILHSRTSVPGAALSGVLSGMDVFFDRLSSPAASQGADVIKSEFEACK